MFGKLICWWNINKTTNHKFRLIANFYDIDGGRAIYQCDRCGFIDVDSNDSFHVRMGKKGIKTRINWHQPYFKPRVKK
jgi:hypothetical protein